MLSLNSMDREQKMVVQSDAFIKYILLILCINTEEGVKKKRKETTLLAGEKKREKKRDKPIFLIILNIQIFIEVELYIR